MKVNKVKAKINTFLGKVLINKYTGIALLRFVKTIKRYGIVIPLDTAIIKPGIAASLFFKTYESAEIRFILKYLNPEIPVLEIGSSIGVVGSIAAKQCNKKVVGIEANYHLREYGYSLIHSNNISNYTIHNQLLYIDNTAVSFEVNAMDNTLGKILRKTGDTNSVIKYERASTFNDLIKEFQLDSDFTLISDIEGAEVYFIFNEADFSNCKMIIIEMHEVEIDNKRYTVDMMVTRLVDLGFRIVDQYGNCFVFEKK